MRLPWVKMARKWRLAARMMGEGQQQQPAGQAGASKQVSAADREGATGRLRDHTVTNQHHHHHQRLPQSHSHTHLKMIRLARLPLGLLHLMSTCLLPSTLHQHPLSSPLCLINLLLLHLSISS